MSRTLLLLLLVAGCGEEGPSEGLRIDARDLRAVLMTDLATDPLEQVDHAVDDERPFLAADLLARQAIPAARRQIERTDELTMATEEGQSLHRRLLAAYRKRLEGLTRYEQALRADAATAGEGHVVAIRLQRESAQEVVRILDRLDAIIPPPAE